MANEQGFTGAHDSDNGFFFHATNVHPDNLNTYNLDELQKNVKFAAFFNKLHRDIKKLIRDELHNKKVIMPEWHLDMLIGERETVSCTYPIYSTSVMNLTALVD